MCVCVLITGCLTMYTSHVRPLPMRSRWYSRTISGGSGWNSWMGNDGGKAVGRKPWAPNGNRKSMEHQWNFNGSIYRVYVSYKNG